MARRVGRIPSAACWHRMRTIMGTDVRIPRQPRPKLTITSNGSIIVANVNGTKLVKHISA